MKLIKDMTAVYFVLVYLLCIGTRHFFDIINIKNEKGVLYVIIIPILLALVYYTVSNILYAFIFKKRGNTLSLSSTLLANIVVIVIVFALSVLYSQIQYGFKPFNPKLFSYMPQIIVLAYAEEIVFRKYLLTILLKYTTKWPAMLISSLFFAFAHFPNCVLRIFITFSLGLLFSFFYLKTKNVAGTTIAHSLWNIIIQNSYGVV